MKILIADDMPTMRKLIEKQFQKIGTHHLVFAENGYQAFQEIEKASEPFDLIISDWNMPIQTGLELLKKVRTKEAYHHTPFIMLTSEGEVINQNEAKLAGVTEYLLKPFDANALLERFEKHIKKSA